MSGPSPSIAITTREVGTFAVLTVPAETHSQAVTRASRDVARSGWAPIDVVSAVPQEPWGEFRVELQVRPTKGRRAHV